MTSAERARLSTLRAKFMLSPEELREKYQLQNKLRQERQNRSWGQEDRLAREFDAGYLAYLRGAAMAGGAPLDTGQYVTVKEAARRLGISRQRAYILVQQGRLEAVRIGENGPWLVNGDNLPEKYRHKPEPSTA